MSSTKRKVSISAPVEEAKRTKADDSPSDNDAASPSVEDDDNEGYDNSDEDDENEEGAEANDQDEDNDDGDEDENADVPPQLTEHETTSTTPPPYDPAVDLPDQWGWVIYRTSYPPTTSDSDYAVAKAKLVSLAWNEDTHESIIGSNGDPETAAVKWVDNQDLLDGKTVAEVRMIHNPNYKPRASTDENEDEDEDEEEGAEGSEMRGDNLCPHACLVLDAGAVRSISDFDETSASSGKPYVIAIDAENDRSEQWVEGDEEGAQMKRVEWDGSMKVAVGAVFDELYCRSVGEGVLGMGEVHPDAGEIWEGVGL